jgi:hypothetical protein
MEPGEPPETFHGSEIVRSLGGIWVLCEGRGDMPGGGIATMVLTLGYDPQKKRYVGTWIGSVMTHLWVYEGSLDAAEQVLILESEGPADGETSTKFKDVIEVKSDDHRVLTSHMLGDDGNWQQFMTTSYRRKK